MRSLKISDHLITNPIKISSKATIREAARTIVENKVSGVLENKNSCGSDTSSKFKFGAFK